MEHSHAGGLQEREGARQGTKRARTHDTETERQKDTEGKAREAREASYKKLKGTGWVRGCQFAAIHTTLNPHISRRSGTPSRSSRPSHAVSSPPHPPPPPLMSRMLLLLVAQLVRGATPAPPADGGRCEGEGGGDAAVRVAAAAQTLRAEVEETEPRTATDCQGRSGPSDGEEEEEEET
jgi:hypothetical protein